MMQHYDSCIVQMAKEVSDTTPLVLIASIKAQLTP